MIKILLHIADCQDVLRGKTSESNEMFSEKNDEILVDGIFADMNDDDQPLLMWFKGTTPKQICMIYVCIFLDFRFLSGVFCYQNYSLFDFVFYILFSGASPVGSLGQSAKAIDKKNENEILSSAIATNDSMDSSTHQKTITNDSGKLIF